MEADIPDESEGLETSMASMALGIVKSIPLPPSSIPVTKSERVKIDGVETDFFVQFFDDRIFLGISQIGGKLGNFLLATRFEADMDVQQLLGIHDVYLEIVAKQVLQQLKHDTIILGISLDRKRGTERAMMKTMIDHVVSMYNQEMNSTS